MKVEYKNQEPMYQSNFLDDILNPNERYTVTFLGNYDEPTINSEKKVPTDLYFVQYSNGSINTVFQYGDEPSQYGSGSSSAYSSLARGKNDGYAEVYKRAVKEGLIKETTSIVGYSEILEERQSEEYFESDYYKNRPDREFYFGSKTYDDLSDDEYDELEEKVDKEKEEYDKKYIAEHGSIPNSGLDKSYHIFDSLEQARELCPPGKGYFKKVTYSSTEHLEAIVREENFGAKIRKYNMEMSKGNDLSP